MTSAKQIRHQQREQWTAAAPGWGKFRKSGDPTSPITERIIHLSEIRPGLQVLDLACGTGDPSLAIAKLVGEEGHVLGLDLTEAMVQGAVSRAREEGVQNASFRTLVSELDLGVPNNTFDLCTCRHGLMFMPDPQAALQNLGAKLKPGGRLTVSTWGLPQNSPAFTLPGIIVGKYTRLPMLDSTGPGLFSIPTPQMLTGYLQGAGLENIRVDKFDCPVMTADSPEELWNRIANMAGPMVKVLRDMPEEKRSVVHDEFVATLSSMFPNQKVVLKAEALVATGIKAD
ncbi:class I SAM-dependent methyltransferase [Alicyclobacillus tolerans]|uniref:class I SAM-dependent methyltransferase n=1 Tax=Alicyclobacillus tolerans TaxID=90970 RepID=UPI001F348EA8|nr:class I SAM-dependent methyltransferase [Alicyclobacillus tolerans]MCF8566838.1 class I SAM-dependent methyltransferase [Alicyclobacillus tolerans]